MQNFALGFIALSEILSTFLSIKEYVNGNYGYAVLFALIVIALTFVFERIIKNDLYSNN